jgi:hypothetical protein
VGAHDLAPARISMPWICPRREFRSPMTSPMNSSGVVTSTSITGSRIVDLPRRIASFNDSEPAILKAISDESTSW